MGITGCAIAVVAAPSEANGNEEVGRQRVNEWIKSSQADFLGPIWGLISTDADGFPKRGLRKLMIDHKL